MLVGIENTSCSTGILLLVLLGAFLTGAGTSQAITRFTSPVVNSLINQQARLTSREGKRIDESKVGFSKTTNMSVKGKIAV